MYRQKSFENDRATLYLVPTPIGNLSEMTSRALEVLHQVHYIAAEDTRNTVKLCNHFEISAKLISHHEHKPSIGAETIKKPITRETSETVGSMKAKRIAIMPVATTS